MIRIEIEADDMLGAIAEMRTLVDAWRPFRGAAPVAFSEENEGPQQSAAPAENNDPGLKPVRGKNATALADLLIQNQVEMLPDADGVLAPWTGHFERLPQKEKDRVQAALDAQDETVEAEPEIRANPEDRQDPEQPDEDDEPEQPAEEAEVVDDHDYTLDEVRSLLAEWYGIVGPAVATEKGPGLIGAPKISSLADMGQAAWNAAAANIREAIAAVNSGLMG